MAETAVPRPDVRFQRHPDSYVHWRFEVAGDVARLRMAVQEERGLDPSTVLKLNSYDLGVDIELYDAVQRLRFEHPEVGAVILTSGKERVFCAGANIRMLNQSAHGWKVNFCKFTNETRNAIEEATAESRQAYVCAVNGPCAGGGYELALACDWIAMADDGNTSVSLPEVPLLAVLPGTGGLTRLVDKRLVRRDHADFFCTTAEGVRGKRARDWRLVDKLIPPSKLADETKKIAEEVAARSNRPKAAKGIALPAVERAIEGDTIRYAYLTIEIDRERRAAKFRVKGPAAAPPADAAAVHAQGAAFWPLALARELDDAMMHLRLNETEIGTWVLLSQGDADLVEGYDALLAKESSNWLVREIVLYWKRTLKRLDVSSRSLIALVEPGSCFAGTLFEIVLAADRSYMLDGTFEGSNQEPATLRLTPMNFGPYPMGNGLTRLGTRFLGEPSRINELKDEIGEALDAETADELGLVTFTPDDIDWEDEVRLVLEERAGFSPDGLIGMEANLRFAGPETMETKIFARLSAWQNWIFQRPNATGPEGALKLYGTGKQSKYDRKRA